MVALSHRGAADPTLAKRQPCVPCLSPRPQTLLAGCVAGIGGALSDAVEHRAEQPRVSRSRLAGALGPL